MCPNSVSSSPIARARRKVKSTIHWVSAEHALPAEVRHHRARQRPDPDLHQDIVTLGFVKDVRVSGGEVLSPDYLRMVREVTQQHGYVHAGIVTTIVDSAGGYAGFTLFPADASVLSVEYPAAVKRVNISID